MLNYHVVSSRVANDMNGAILINLGISVLASYRNQLIVILIHPLSFLRLHEDSVHSSQQFEAIFWTPHK